MGQATPPATIIPGEFPELALIAWNRDPMRPIPAAEAFALYEANWRHVDPARLTPPEAALVEALAHAFGPSEILASGRR